MGVETLVYAGATLLSAGASYKANKENQDYQKEQNRVQSRLNKLAARQEKVSAYRERIKAEASQVQTATQAGGATSGLQSSGFQGGISSLETQYNANAQYVNSVNNLREYSGNITNDAAKYQSLSNLFGGISEVAGTNFGGKAGVNRTMNNMFRGS